MTDPVFDRTAFPNPLVTTDDYEKACAEFAQPFLLHRAALVQAGIEKLQAKLDDITVEEIEEYSEAVKANSSFPDDVQEFLEEIADLEASLEQEGAFNEEPV